MSATMESRPTIGADSPPRYRTLFRVPFESAMTEADAARLARLLDMPLYLRPKLPVLEGTQGVARLDFSSGLFLVRGDGSDAWRLEGRTWGSPPPEIVAGWHLAAAAAARLLDPSVPTPHR